MSDFCDMETSTKRLAFSEVDESTRSSLGLEMEFSPMTGMFSSVSTLFSPDISLKVTGKARPSSLRIGGLKHENLERGRKWRKMAKTAHKTDAWISVKVKLKI